MENVQEALDTNEDEAKRKRKATGAPDHNIPEHVVHSSSLSSKMALLYSYWYIMQVFSGLRHHRIPNE